MPRFPVSLLLMCVLLGIALPLVFAKQTQSFPPPKEPYNPYANAQFGEVHAGEFTGDLLPDGVVLDGGIPTLLASPATQFTAYAANDPVRDLDVLPQSLPDNRDSVLTIGANGVEQLEWDLVDGEWDSFPKLASGWVGGRSIRVGQFDGLHGLDIVALADETIDDKRVLVAFSDGLGGFVEEPGFWAFESAREIEVLDGDGDGTDEIVALTSYGAEIYEPDGTYVDDTPWAFAPIYTATLPETTSAAEQLIMVTSGPQGNDWLTVWGQSGSETFLLGPVDVFFATTGDMDGDGDADLLLADHSQNAVLQLSNISELGGPSFDPVGELEVLPFGNQNRDPAQNQSSLAITDFDHDGDNDILAPAQGTGSVDGTLELLPGSVVDEDALKIPIDSVDWDEVAGELVVQFGAPDQKLDAGPDLLDLEILVWRAPDLDEPTDPAPFVAETYLPVPLGAALTEFRFSPPPGYTHTSLDVFTIQVRQAVRKVGTLELLDIAPSEFAVYASEANEGSLSLLSGGTYWLELTWNNNSTAPGGGVSIGTHEPSYDPSANSHNT